MRTGMSTPHLCKFVRVRGPQTHMGRPKSYACACAVCSVRCAGTWSHNAHMVAQLCATCLELPARPLVLRRQKFLEKVQKLLSILQECANTALALRRRSIPKISVSHYASALELTQLARTISTCPFTPRVRLCAHCAHNVRTSGDVCTSENPCAAFCTSHANQGLRRL
eukprot:1197546-Rhodomonas_salina.2